jgi:hypothetical protein
MRFYYISIISIAMLAAIYLVGTAILGFIWWEIREHWKRVWLLMVPLYVLLLVSPIAEELWIAWNFGQLCKKDAGIVVYKTVEVEGFYDATGSALGVLRDDKYQWMEGPARDGRGASRLTRGDTEFTQQAIQRYEQENPLSSAADQGWIRVQMDKTTEALVFPKKKESWRIIKLDHPTARYHYRNVASHLSIAHGVKKFENAVLDTQTGVMLGRYVNYYRSAPWFFIGLGRPTIPCQEAEQDTRKYGTLMVYALVLRNVSGAESVGDK